MYGKIWKIIAPCGIYLILRTVFFLRMKMQMKFLARISTQDPSNCKSKISKFQYFDCQFSIFIHIILIINSGKLKKN